MTATITLRPLRATDRDRVHSIVEATRVFRPDEVPVALEVVDGAVEAPATDYWSIGAVDGDRLVGYTTFGPVPCTLSTWDLYWLVVDPADQRRGIARLLMAHSERNMVEEGGRLAVVETSSRPAYGAARAFYERLGYERSATIPGYYAPGDDLIVYTKDLRDPEEGATDG